MRFIHDELIVAWSIGIQLSPRMNSPFRIHVTLALCDSDYPSHAGVWGRISRCRLYARVRIVDSHAVPLAPAPPNIFDALLSLP